MVNRIFALAVFFLSILLPLSAAAQFQQIKLPLTVHDAADTTKTIYWGLDVGATSGLDSAFDEFELPPVAPQGHFDVRWVNIPGSTVLGQGCETNIRAFVSAVQADTYRVRFQPAMSAYPMTLKWRKDLVASDYLSTTSLIDYPSGALINLDMKSVDSLVVTDTSIISMMLIMRNPIGPNEIMGEVFEDRDGDGANNDGDSGLSSWQVALSGSVADTIATDAYGRYRFSNLTDGTVTVTAIRPPGWVQTTLPVSFTFELTGGTTGIADFGNFRLATLAGAVFNDANGNGTRDSSEPGIAGWRIVLSGAPSDTTSTDVTGHYAFTSVGPGVHRLSEIQDTGWVQIAPGAPGYFETAMSSGESVDSLLFGNKYADRFTGTPGGSWSDSANWSSGHPPGAGDAVVVTAPVVVDVLPDPHILALRIAQGGSITYSSADRLDVTQSIQIEEGSTLTFGTPPAGMVRPSAAQNGLICEGDFILKGTLRAGTSLITFAGDRPKTIFTQSSTGFPRMKALLDAGTNPFYDLQISGANTGIAGNISIADHLILNRSLDAPQGDTIFVLNPSPDAILDSGLIPRGTISRSIQPGSTASYRFESPLSALQFDGTGTYPPTVDVTTVPDSTPSSSHLAWQVIGGVVDTIGHTVAVDSISKFSKWPFGTHGGISRQSRMRSPEGGETFGVPRIKRFYVVHPQGGAGFLAHLQLRYDPSEVPAGLPESSLELLRGPLVVDSISERWNLISLPVALQSGRVDSLFPSAISKAFKYQGGSYQTDSLLRPGRGYWLKFPSNGRILMEGGERIRDTVALTGGWNLIGALSAPVAAVDMVSMPQGNITSSAFGYKGGYTIADSLIPMRGYWVKAQQDGLLILDASPKFGIPRGAASMPPDERLNRLIVEDGKGNRGSLYFGTGAGGEGGRWDLPPLPPEGIFDVRYATGTMAEFFPQSGSRDVIVRINSAVPPVVLRWEIYGSPGGAALTVGGRKFALHTNASLTLDDASAPVVLSLTASGPAMEPEKFGVSQNYPNPFNPTTAIDYVLPEASHVSLVIFDLLGREVKTLVEGDQEAGRHTVVWNATDGGGRNLASSVYFYRLRASGLSPATGSHTIIRKMILLR